MFGMISYILMLFGELAAVLVKRRIVFKYGFCNGDILHWSSGSLLGGEPQVKSRFSEVRLRSTGECRQCFIFQRIRCSEALMVPLYDLFTFMNRIGYVCEIDASVRKNHTSFYRPQKYQEFSRLQCKTNRFSFPTQPFSARGKTSCWRRRCTACPLLKPVKWKWGLHGG